MSDAEPSPLAAATSPRSPTGGRLPGRASSRGKRDGRPSSQTSLEPAVAAVPLPVPSEEQSAAAAAASNPDAGSSNITGGLHLPNFNPAEVEEDPEEDPILKQKAHQDDDIVFDTARPYMPPAHRGNWFLLASIGVQSLMLIFLFLGFHHKDSSFNCCNAYAVTVVVLFEVIQFAAYFLDWRSIEGFNPMWHRSNLFSPVILFAVIFVLWGIGTFAMMAHVIDVDLFLTFTKGFTKITPLQQASFVIATVVGVVDVCLFMTISYAHRNNLGHFYYLNHETPVELTQLIDYTIPVSGSFGLSHHFQDLASKLQVETSRKASKNLPLLIMVAAALQIPFYVFCAASYSGGNQSSLPIIALCVGSICVASQASYIMGAATNRARKTRKWNRTNMFFPIIAAYAIIGTYFFTMTSVFFTNEQNAEIWENILEQLDPFERACFTICLICVCVIFLLHILLTNLHRKGWCEGSKEIEIMLKATANLDGRKNIATSKPAARFQAALLAADRASGINAKTAPLAFGKSKIKTKAGKKAPALFSDMTYSAAAAALGSGGALKIGGDQSDTDGDISVKKPSALRAGDRLRPGMDLSVTREADEYSTSRR